MTSKNKLRCDQMCLEVQVTTIFTLPCKWRVYLFLP